ncbi:hypothetical protein PoB_005920600 [Plakobranchus ocellatus]|uniref:Uncharacterized protein n=1 Tax=Plakobranchus ocellatus TaxID=259542 RepID=A0AAV4CLS8_9GAST|nr:hypothetical protein PoB_005920600 [Plakobranchus ocellatus]
MRQTDKKLKGHRQGKDLAEHRDRAVMDSCETVDAVSSFWSHVAVVVAESRSDDNSMRHEILKSPLAMGR